MENKASMKKIITESQLKQIVMESVKRVLCEGKVFNNRSYFFKSADDGDFYENDTERPYYLPKPTLNYGDDNSDEENWTNDFDYSDNEDKSYPDFEYDYTGVKPGEVVSCMDDATRGLLGIKSLRYPSEIAKMSDEELNDVIGQNRELGRKINKHNARANDSYFEYGGKTYLWGTKEQQKAEQEAKKELRKKEAERRSYIRSRYSNGKIDNPHNEHSYYNNPIMRAWGWK